MWSRDIYVPANQVIPYRYLICSVEPITENVHVRRWETHLEPRQILANPENDKTTDTVPKPAGSPSTSAPDMDTFGDINGLEKIDRGWLTTETVYQFKFIRNPFLLKQKLQHRLLYVKVSERIKRCGCEKCTCENIIILSSVQVKRDFYCCSYDQSLVPSVNVQQYDYS